MARLRLISFKLCPYVQRSVIALELKKQSYEIKYIDLSNKPEWFLKISPLGKVPVLQVDDEVIFESSVINEYLDETLPPQLHPMDPLSRARHRAWIAFAGELLGHQFRLSTAQSDENAKAAEAQLADGVRRIGTEVIDGPYFGGKEPTLVDAAVAPLFVRQDILERRFNVPPIEGSESMQAWRDALIALNAVKRSVVEDFEQRYVDFVQTRSGPRGVGTAVLQMDLPTSLTISALLLLGFFAQWLAWRVRLPAILFLLIIGLVLGPVLGLLNPSEDMGELLFPLVSLAVAVILFEGSLTLRFEELRGVGRCHTQSRHRWRPSDVGRLALSAHYLVGLPWDLALLFGAIGSVTGPTVIVPMLRSLRPNAAVANILRWEGIIVDPLGAVLAVLVFEASCPDRRRSRS